MMADSTAAAAVSQLSKIGALRTRNGFWKAELWNFPAAKTERSVWQTYATALLTLFVARTVADTN